MGKPKLMNKADLNAKVVSYVRCSTDKQTIEVQATEIKKYCEYKNIEVDKSYVDYAISGKTFDSFKQLIKKFIPNKLIKLRQMIKDANNVDEMNKLGLFTINSGDNCYLRGILKKK